MDDEQVQTAARRIKEGTCTPIISNELIIDQYFGQEAAGKLAGDWARSERVGYPLELDEDKYDLSCIAQYCSTVKGSSAAKSMYHDHLKKRFIEDVKKADARADVDDIDEQRGDFTFTQLVLEQLQHPGFGQRLAPAADGAGDGTTRTIVETLATFKAKVFITTSPHTFLESALKKYQKTPRSKVYDPLWASRGEDDAGATGTGEATKSDEWNPMVYHLLGKEDFDDSLVLSEDDYLSVLPRLFEDRKNTKVVPGEVSDALTRSYLLLLGYDVASWEFRIVLRLIATQYPRPRGIAVQIDPYRAPGKVKDRDAYLAYLKKVFGDPELTVFAGTPWQLVGDLAKRLKGG